MPTKADPPGESAPVNEGVSTEPIDQELRDAGVTTRLRCLFPHSSFNPSIDGVEPIRDSGTDVPSKHLDSIHAAAKASGVRLQEVKS